MLLKFLRDERGNYAMLTAIAMVPIMGCLALAIDYTEASRQRQATLNALDAAGIATAVEISRGVSDEEAEQFAKDFFVANLGPVKPENTELDVDLPDMTTGGGTLVLTADLKYKPYFYPAFQALRKASGSGETDMAFSARSEIQLKNTIEVALVLDNSGSMDYKGSGSGKKRIDLLKDAAKELVSTLSQQAGSMKQINAPVQFGVVPFAASVNVGTKYKNASWMDTEGRSSIHHENFDWSDMSSGNKQVVKESGVWKKKGKGWPKSEQNTTVSRFTLFDATTIHSWAGCVEIRPGDYGLNDAVPTSANPDTLFVPMFAPDETDETWYSRPANNNWWKDYDYSSEIDDQARMKKYFDPTKARLDTSAIGPGKGPNLSCTTKPITPLTDVATKEGLKTIEDAIDDMQAGGATNVPDGLAWGWRVVSGPEPFKARPETERGNDKVVIVLTDGANTYYRPDSITAQPYSGSYYRYGGNDLANNRSIYSSFGYARNKDGKSRIFENTSVNKSDFSNSNYTKAMNDKMAEVCRNAKTDGNIIIMAVALDLDEKDKTDKAQIDGLKDCVSTSRFRTDGNGNAAKLFWNATGANLSEKFKEIADELSNLRIVS